MKKYLLSAFVICTFLGYSFYQRVYGQEAVNTTKPTPTDLPTPSPTSPPEPTAVIIKKVTDPTSTPAPTAKPSSPYKDGSYSGDAADAFYGNIQVQVTIASGKITNVDFLQYPNAHGHSVEINSQADPLLAQEAIQAQSANVNIISGATDSSQAFMQSLQSALNKAKS